MSSEFKSAASERQARKMEKLRRIRHLHDVEGLSFKEIGQMFDTTAGNVSYQYNHEAKRALDSWHAGLSGLALSMVWGYALAFRRDGTGPPLTSKEDLKAFLLSGNVTPNLRGYSVSKHNELLAFVGLPLLPDEGGGVKGRCPHCGAAIRAKKNK